MPSRVRNRSSAPSFGFVQKFRQYDGQPATLFHTGPTQNTTEDIDVMTDVVTPSYHRRIASGAVINNPCHLVVSSRQSGGGSYDATGNNPRYYTVNNGGSLTQYEFAIAPFSRLVTDLIDTSELIAKAKSAAIAGIDSTPYDFLEDGLEFRETLRFLRNPISSLSKVAKAFRRSYSDRLKSGLDKAQALSGAYLSYRFALSPLVRSVLSGYEAYQDKSRKRPSRRSSHRREADSDSSSRSYNRYLTSTAYDTYSESARRTVTVHVSILYEVSNPLFDQSFKLGFRLKDLPTGFWQIVPYSFIVDRVINVTDIIRGATNLLDPKVSILAGSVTVKDESESSLQFVSQHNPPWSVQVSGDTIKDKVFIYDRTPWHPSLSDIVPPASASGLIKDATSIVDLLTLSINRLRI